MILGLPVEGGTSTRRATLEAVWRSTGKKPLELDGEKCPEGMAYLWEMFVRIRVDGCLTPNELLSWATLYGVVLVGSEIEALFQLDELRRQVTREHHERRNGQQASSRRRKP